MPVSDILQQPSLNPLLEEVLQRREQQMYRRHYAPLGAISQRSAELVSSLPDPDARFGLPTPKSDAEVRDLFQTPTRNPLLPAAYRQPPEPGLPLTRHYNSRFDRETAFGIPSGIGVDRTGQATKDSISWAHGHDQPEPKETTAQAQGKAIMTAFGLLPTSPLRRQTGSSTFRKNNSSNNDNLSDPSSIEEPVCSIHPAPRHRAARDHGDVLTWGVPDTHLAGKGGEIAAPQTRQEQWALHRRSEVLAAAMAAEARLQSFSMEKTQGRTLRCFVSKGAQRRNGLD
ncbi:hypothetical protein BC828DRAFT_373274 [Blastocladiella britannica]|nr:hypothetical protein BC828DRAFT_373274 [Blastocladiella britannica]